MNISSAKRAEPQEDALLLRCCKATEVLPQRLLARRRRLGVSLAAMLTVLWLASPAAAQSTGGNGSPGNHGAAGGTGGGFGVVGGTGGPDSTFYPGGDGGAGAAGGAGGSGALLEVAAAPAVRSELHKR